MNEKKKKTTTTTTSKESDTVNDDTCIIVLFKRQWCNTLSTKQYLLFFRVPIHDKVCVNRQMLLVVDALGFPLRHHADQLGADFKRVNRVSFVEISVL